MKIKDIRIDMYTLVAHYIKSNYLSDDGYIYFSFTNTFNDNIYTNRTKLTHIKELFTSDELDIEETIKHYIANTHRTKHPIKEVFLHKKGSFI